MIRKIFIILLLLGSIAFSMGGSAVKEIEGKIIEKIVRDITNHRNPTVYILGEDLNYSFIREYTDLNITDNPSEAEIILVFDVTDLHRLKKTIKKKPAFAIGYLSFLKCKNCIGGFYWRKGRPQIIFIQEKLKKFNLKLPSEYKRYIIPEKFVRK